MIVRDPVYQQLNQHLRGLVAGGSFADGARFLTEREISQRFGVSRATANKAVSNLVSEGVLEFRKGIGTFVHGGSLNYDLRVLVSFTDKARASGRRPGTRVLSFSRSVDVPDDARESLGLAPGEPAFFMERLRLADGVPVILERRYVVSSLCPKLSRRDVAESLYGALTERHGLTIGGADQTIRAINMPAGDARLLGAARGTAGLMVLGIGTLADQRPLWFERTLYRADAYEFHTRLGGIRAVRPAVGKLRLAKSA